MKKILILGAASAIAQETARCFAKEGSAFFLAARSQEKLRIISDDLKCRGASEIFCLETDLNDVYKHASLIDQALRSLKGLDLVLLTYGTLGDQKKCEASYEETLKELQTNFLSAVSLLTLLSNHMESLGRGSLAVITSVAGDRGGAGNYVYGTAKGALSIFLEGLRGRLTKSGVHVLTVKPGFVDTPMTARFRKGFLFASAKSVGEGIHHAILKKKDVVYLPWFWKPVMCLVKMIPEGIFKRLNLSN